MGCKHILTILKSILSHLLKKKEYCVGTGNRLRAFSALQVFKFSMPIFAVYDKISRIIRLWETDFKKQTMRITLKSHIGGNISQQKTTARYSSIKSQFL